MTGSLGDLYGPIQDDPVPDPVTAPKTGYDATPPPVGTEENPPLPSDDDVVEIVMMLKAMGAEIDLDRFHAMCMDPRAIKPSDTLTFQLPKRMKDVTSKLSKVLALQHDEMALSQVHRAMLLIVLRHLPELVDLLNEAGREAQRQRTG